MIHTPCLPLFRTVLITCAILLNFSAPAAAQEKQLWHGYEILDSTLNGRNMKIVFPDQANENRDWIWRARFWGHEPQTDLALLKEGFHVAYMDVAGLFGNREAVGIWDEFYTWATEEFGLNPKVVLEGLSRGGLIVYNWANRNADRVACIYADAPVCDLKSWPMGMGKGTGSEQARKVCLEQYGFTEKQALSYRSNPVDHMENIARARVPILHVVGDADSVVPVSENTDLLKARLNELDWDLKVIHKPGVGHHPHSLEDPEPIVNFILIHTQGFKRLFNGKDWDGWYLKIRNGDAELAGKVFSIENGMVHIFNSEFPDVYELGTDENNTHGLFYTKKKYSKYHLRFEYKWGSRIANNFDAWQYDAGCYYHVIDDMIWPTGFEYQIRYDHTKARNHTGDLIRPGGTDYDWFSTENGKTYLHPDDGGVPDTTSGWLHHAKVTENYHALDNKWNQCEIIVMGDQYAIHKLNGEVVNMAFNLVPSEGIIGLQAETAEIFYRNIEIKEFDAIIPSETFLK